MGRMWEIREEHEPRYGYRDEHVDFRGGMSSKKDDSFDEGYECGYEDGYRKAMKEAKRYYEDKR